MLKQASGVIHVAKHPNAKYRPIKLVNMIDNCCKSVFGVSLIDSTESTKDLQAEVEVSSGL